MAHKKSVPKETQYNTEMYMARLTLKNPAVKFAAVIVCIYAVIRTVWSIIALAAGGNILVALLSSAGMLLLAAGSVGAWFLSRDGGGRLLTSLSVSVIGTVVLVLAVIAEIIFLKADGETVVQAVFMLCALLTAAEISSAAAGKSAKTSYGYLLGISGLATTVLSVIALLSVCSALRGCFAQSYNWSFFVEEVDVDTVQIKWYFLSSRMTGTTVKAVFNWRFAERIMYVILLASVSVVSLKISPYINKEKRNVEFAQDAGGFSAFDGDDFRTISKKRASENIRNQSYYGIGSMGTGESEREEQPLSDAPRYKTNEYGDYLDEETGIFYYYDNRTGKYYYLDEKSGEYVYKSDNRGKSQINPADAMPWEIEDELRDDEENIYIY